MRAGTLALAVRQKCTWGSRELCRTSPRRIGGTIMTAPYVAPLTGAWIETNNDLSLSRVYGFLTMSPSRFRVVLGLGGAPLPLRRMACHDSTTQKTHQKNVL